MPKKLKAMKCGFNSFEIPRSGMGGAEHVLSCTCEGLFDLRKGKLCFYIGFRV
jgi:hypothetical protein